MRAAVTRSAGVIDVVDRPEPDVPTPGDTLLRVETVGICGSDLHLYRADLGPSHEGLFPLVQGHELSAVVAAEDPAGNGHVAGSRVAVWPVTACGQCRMCRDGRPNACRALRLVGVHHDGGLQEYLRVPTAALVGTAELTASEAALVEPMSIAVHAVARARITSGEQVIVLGAGPIGLATALAATDAGGSVTVVDPVGSRRARAEALGAAAAWDLDLEDLAHDIAGPDGPHVVIDTTGNAAVLDRAIAATGQGGRLVVVGMTGAAAPTHPGPLPLKELDVLGVSCCVRHEFEAAADLVRLHPGLTDTFVSHRLPLERTAEAIEQLEADPDDAFKVLVDVGATADHPTTDHPTN